ncbi:MAG: class SAM-dependent methyltransferase [Verrucomicrobiales bacterium]|nr:class SAM-dependent methyltransferase [Verrucomicrobiales bacterium]
MQHRKPNAYTPEWFEFFHRAIPSAGTEQECASVRSVCPLPLYQCILDVCCGMGRHAHRLAGAGYRVTGIKRNADPGNQILLTNWLPSKACAFCHLP